MSRTEIKLKRIYGFDYVSSIVTNSQISLIFSPQVDLINAYPSQEVAAIVHLL